ncbi:MAG: type II toxin-antitoxin system HigB family toxin [bacterium]|nr:type II toxin-antitoxin system HigB family toxin [bacterium]
MHIITRKRLNEFTEKHPDAKSSLQHWYRLMKSGRFLLFTELRATFPNADQVGNLTVWDGSPYCESLRLIVIVYKQREKGK